MKLIERAEFLTALEKMFEEIQLNEGHCVLISGEAGIGKTSVTKEFTRDKKRKSKVFTGTCDALFTPRPLGPLYDILLQMKVFDAQETSQVKDRLVLFNRFLQEVGSYPQSTIVIIEDIHWADEATLDFINFFARRITQFHCLLILTYRDDEIYHKSCLRPLLGQLPPDSFTRLKLTPLSIEAVQDLAVKRGYSGEDVYSISGGIPFYVNEILANYSPGIPHNIKDSVLSVYGKLDEQAQHVCQILSILPTGFEIKYLERLEPLYADAIQKCLDFGILILRDLPVETEQAGDFIFFKHELYRRTIETSLSPFLRLILNKKVLDLFLESFEQKGELVRIVHHAKNANANELVVKYAPQAAMQAASLGAHVEASRLYYSAIEYYLGDDEDVLIKLYESYAYECYIINEIKDAIIYQEKALRIWTGRNDVEKVGDCLRILSRLWSSGGNLKKAEAIGMEAIEVFEKCSASKAKAKSLSNMSQIKMYLDLREECIYWGNKAISMANELGDEETLCQALINIGGVEARMHPSREKGVTLLMQSLEIALRNTYEELAIRAYTNLVANALWIKDYAFAKKNLEEGIQYCEERDIVLGAFYLLSLNAWLNLDMGNWDEALRVASAHSASEYTLPFFKVTLFGIVAKIKIRRGDENILAQLLQMKDTLETREVYQLLPIFSILLEYEWIMGKTIIDNADLEFAIELATGNERVYINSEFAFWLWKSRKQTLQVKTFFEGHQFSSMKLAKRAAEIWKQISCPYEQAVALFEGNEEDKRKALDIMQKLGADGVYKRMKFNMRFSGIKKIPRGIRRSTMSNPANLTERELGVLELLKDGLQNKEIGAKLFISPKTVNHHVASILFKLDVNSRAKAVQEAIQLAIVKR